MLRNGHLGDWWPHLKSEKRTCSRDWLGFIRKRPTGGKSVCLGHIRADTSRKLTRLASEQEWRGLGIMLMKGPFSDRWKD
jgi:hypothetical protein